MNRSEPNKLGAGAGLAVAGEPAIPRTRDYEPLYSDNRSLIPSPPFCFFIFLSKTRASLKESFFEYQIIFHLLLRFVYRDFPELCSFSLLLRSEVKPIYFFPAVSSKTYTTYSICKH